MSQETPETTTKPPQTNGIIARSYMRLSNALWEVEQERDPPTPGLFGGLNLHVVGLIAFASLMLTLQEYYGSSRHWTSLQTPLSWIAGKEDAVMWTESVFRKGQYARLARLWYWGVATSVVYLWLPLLYVKVVMRDKARNFGFRLQGVWSHAWIYVTLFLIVLPFLFLVGQTDSFQRTYPFYKQAGRSPFDFFGWQLAYALQFLSLEFFFRGFLVHGLRRSFGAMSILIAIMPYCMIHFGKPMPETLGSIFAGLALGILSLLTRSVWLGVAIHISVALSMDVISLWFRGDLF